MADAIGRVVDADGHVLEPADTWIKYLEPAHRDRAIRIARDDQGYEVLLVDGRPLKTLRGQLGALGGIEMDTRELLTRGQVSYAEGSPAGGYDPLARLRVMDAEGIDAVLLYPTIGICWEGHVTDGALATAYTRAYNRWLAEFCRAAPPLSRGAHLAAGSRGRGGGNAPGAQGRLRRNLSFARSRGPRRAPLRRPRLRALLGDRAGSRDAGRLPRRRAGSAMVPAVAAKRSLRRSLQHRLPRHRRDGRLHTDAERRHVRALSAPALRRARGRIELDRRVARSPRPQAPRARPPDAHHDAAQRVFLPAVPDLRGSGRIGHRADDRAPRRRLLRLGLGLSAHRRLVRCRTRAEGAPRAAAGRGASESPRAERAEVLPARVLSHPNPPPARSTGREGESGCASRSC